MRTYRKSSRQPDKKQTAVDDTNGCRQTDGPTEGGGEIHGHT